MHSYLASGTSAKGINTYSLLPVFTSIQTLRVTVSTKCVFHIVLSNYYPETCISEKHEISLPISFYKIAPKDAIKQRRFGRERHLYRGGSRSCSSLRYATSIMVRISPTNASGAHWRAKWCPVPPLWTSWVDLGFVWLHLYATCRQISLKAFWNSNLTPLWIFCQWEKPRCKRPWKTLDAFTFQNTSLAAAKIIQIPSFSLEKPCLDF